MSWTIPIRQGHCKQPAELFRANEHTATVTFPREYVRISSPFRQFSVCKDGAVRRLGEFLLPAQFPEARSLESEPRSGLEKKIRSGSRVFSLRTKATRHGVG